MGDLRFPGSALTGEQFLHRAMTLINCLVGIRSRSRIGIRDCDSPKTPASNVAWSLTLRPIWIPQRVVLICVSVWPPVDGDSLDVAGGIKTAATQHANKLVADVSCLLYTSPSPRD